MTTTNVLRHGSVSKGEGRSKKNLLGEKGCFPVCRKGSAAVTRMGLGSSLPVSEDLGLCPYPGQDMLGSPEPLICSIPAGDHGPMTLWAGGHRSEQMAIGSLTAQLTFPLPIKTSSFS